MFLNDLVYWYQKKIGTYDKEQWEKRVEQRIFGGFGNVPMRNAKLKTELIDVDLVRGSSFPKAKPKHGLSTVAWLAALRLIFLPLYRSWWIGRTSPGVFCLFFLLYCLQLFNTCAYFGAASTDRPRIVSPGEVLMPVGMMFVLCVVHSQIVSTSSGATTASANNATSAAAARNGSRLRRSRHERCRTGKMRSRRNLRTNEARSSREMADETTRARGRAKSDSSPASAVRFAKSVSIGNATTGVGKVQLETESNVEERTSVISSVSSLSSTSAQPPTAPTLAPPPPPLLPSPEPIANEARMENPVNEDVVRQQDDDGFESLNGNVSSDNDRARLLQARPEERLRTRYQRAPESHADVANRFERGHPRAGRENEGCDRATWSESADTRYRLLARSPKPKYSSEMDSDRRGIDSEPTARAGSRPECSKNVSRDERRRECESEEEGECEEAPINHFTEATTSATEWMGVTSNSDVCSYSSDLEESDVPCGGGAESNAANYADFVEHPFFWELELPSSVPLGSSCTSSDRVSCTIWTRRDIKKVELSVLDISSAIIARVESMPEGMDYVYGGLSLAVVLSLIPSIKRLSDEFSVEGSGPSSSSSNLFSVANLTGPNFLDFTQMSLEVWSKRLCDAIDVAFGSTPWERAVVLSLAFEKLALSCLLFFLLAVAERTFKQRLLYAKLFSHLTSSRRARKSDLPHFRLNKFRNIKTWLSVRAYLKRRGPQRSVDVIVSAVFIVTLLLLSFVSLELIRDLENLHSRYNVEALLWSFALGIYILRFMTLGSKINKKYRNLSTLITEQINLYLQMEQKPHKKDELMVANSVLKLAADLIKELECPFKISGLSANPYLYTITKVVLLSALSGVLSELLGFKLKLHKITIK